ncbi:MAG: HAMP domain-containing histidine kinase, partial [Candidatus Eisenbacteria bacterium]|nr:HAMP domain-containing histidine kinase [Candidatus Eisenbacteria bacterium]
MNIKFANSLRGRFIIFIGGLSVLTTLLLASFHFFQVRSALLGQLEKRGFSVAEQLVQAAAPDIEDENLSHIEDYLWDICADPEVRFVILQDARGQVLADCSHPSVDLALIRSHFVSGAWRPDAAHFFPIKTPNDALFSFSAPVYASGEATTRLGTIRVGITTQPTLASIDRAFWVGIGTWVILGSIGFLGVGFITRLALAPLDRMVGVARSISKGDMSQRVAIDALDEIGSLGVAFNEMSASLASSRDALDARNRELEQVARDRERSLAELKEAQDRLAHSEGTRHAEKLRSVGQMASGVAHDFNNVLAAITGRTQLLKLKLERESPGDQPLKDSLNVIERAALDGAETVRRIQEFSREQHEKAMTRADLNHIVREAVEITRPRWRSQAEQHGARVEVECKLPRVPQIACVPSEIREILTNLIFNSVDAMDSGGTIAISTESLDDGVQLILADTGSGMSDDVKEHIFEPFFTTKGLKGNGL